MYTNVENLLLYSLETQPLFGKWKKIDVFVFIALYVAETWTLRAADQKYLENFEMWCWRGMEKISWTDHVRNEEVLLRVN